MDVQLTRSALAVLRSETANAHPRECCGILLGESGRVAAIQPAANIHPASETHFEIDPQALVDAHRAARSGGPQVIGYYHSHPAGPAHPSATDAAMANRDGSIWAIVGQAGDVTFWCDGEEGFAALPYTLTDV